jgi:hypothetical protein
MMNFYIVICIRIIEASLTRVYVAVTVAFFELVVLKICVFSCFLTACETFNIDST